VGGSEQAKEQAPLHSAQDKAGAASPPKALTTASAQSLNATLPAAPLPKVRRASVHTASIARQAPNGATTVTANRARFDALLPLRFPKLVQLSTSAPRADEKTEASTALEMTSAQGSARTEIKHSQVAPATLRRVNAGHRVTIPPDDEDYTSKDQSTKAGRHDSDDENYDDEHVFHSTRLRDGRRGDGNKCIFPVCCLVGFSCCSCLVAAAERVPMRKRVDAVFGLAMLLLYIMLSFTTLLML
jgi:hypothetical protein